MKLRNAIIALLAFTLAAAACTEAAEDASESPNTTGAETTTTITPGVEPILLEVNAGVGQLTISDLDLGDQVSVIANGDQIRSQEASNAGTILFRDLPPGQEVSLLLNSDEGIMEGVNVLGTEPPDQSFYDEQELTSGFQYITTRDGTTLSANIVLPGSATGGPYPILVEYSGYEPSNPAADDVSRTLLPLMGYGLVQVNVRGTGCSGGSFDVFEPIQDWDGYDVIEVVAAQDFASGVGMWGVSYPAIMQLHVAATSPPSLKAIAPLSITDDIGNVLYPGGIYNNGFAQEWAKRVGDRAVANGQPWAKTRAEAGDTECEDNQSLRLHNPDQVAAGVANEFKNDFSDSRSVQPVAKDIAVPVFIAGAWQDEQTGGHFPAILDDFAAAPVVQATMYNGMHIDPLSPDVIVPLVEFYDIYVREAPAGLNPIARQVIGGGASLFFGQSLQLPPNNYTGLSAAEAKAAFESEPPIRILWEQGTSAPGLPVPNFTSRHDAWPIPDVQPLRWHINGETLSPDVPAEAGVKSYVTDPSQSQEITVENLKNIWTADPGWTWQGSQPNNGAVFTSAAVDSDIALAGTASADLYVSLSDANDADIEATLIDVGPDGSETYIQSGWLRLSRRALAAESTELLPVQTHLESDVSELEPGAEPELARLEIFPFAHVLRTGHQLRISLDTPGGSRAQWRFDSFEFPTEVNIHWGPDTPSSIVLPKVNGLDIPATAPACGALRAQPCRP